MNEDGKLVARSKGVQQYPEAPDKMFLEGIKYIQTQIDQMKKLADKNIYFYCEYLRKPKHNVLVYKKMPKNYLCLFDAMVEGKWMDRSVLKSMAKELDIDLTPELYKGKIDVEGIKKLLTIKSYLGGPVVEGVVIKNYNQTILMGGNLYPLFTKYVREEFKEKHTKEWKTKTPRGSIELLMEEYRAEARWQKAIIHAKEQSKLTKSPKDIGMLMKMVKEDLEEEEKENIKKALWKITKERLLRRSVAGLPQWYKKKLLEDLEAKNGKK